MDDDFTFGASVWSSNEPLNLLPTPKETPSTVLPPESNHQLEDFDGFGPPSQIAQTEAGDDDFGDFGDFGEAEEMTISTDFGEETAFGDELQIAGPSSQAEWKPLRLDPMPSKVELEEEVNDILAPLWGNEDISEVTTAEGIREVEGISQILVTAERRDLYNMLFQSPPPTKPPNWTRSRIRRQHLIALGIPVNLDEVLPHANGKPLPPLQISTRPMSAPPGPRNPPHSSNAVASTSHSRAGTPQPSSRAGPSPFGPKPNLDETKISELLDLSPNNLTLQPLPILERYLADLRAQTANTSSLLTFLLQTRESLQQDSETYNKLIAELVGEAQKVKTGKSRTTSKRGSGVI